MTTLWYRQPYAPLAWSDSQQQQLLATLTAGQSILTVWYSWGFAGASSTNMDMVNHSTNWCASGIVTTIGNGSETVPDPVTDSGDQAPPTQRWLWWETRYPQVISWDARTEVATWKSNEPQFPMHSKGMVLATGLPAGDSLHLWFTWRSHHIWDDTGNMRLWLSSVVGVRSP